MSENTQSTEIFGEEKTAEQTVVNETADMETAEEKTEVTGEHTGLSRYPKGYFLRDGNLYVKEMNSKGETELFVSNFTPYISKVITYDDGVIKVNKYAVCGEVSGGRKLPEVIVECDEILSLNWVTRLWDTECNIGTGYGAKDKLRFALQATTPAAERIHNFTTTGWHDTEDGLYYLLPGIQNYPVCLEGKMQNYFMEGGTTLEDIQAMDELFKCKDIPTPVLHTCIAFTFLSPLNYFLKMGGCEPKFILTIVGRTGSMKSCLAAIFESFFGNFTQSDSPITFADTGNSMVEVAHRVKDVLACTDDYHPTNGTDVVAFKQKAQMLARAIGDRTGRNRLNSNIELRPNNAPQGNILMTAEHIPDIGESGIARLFVVNLMPGDISPARITELQRQAASGVFRRVLFSYLSILQAVFIKETESEEFAAALVYEHMMYRDECNRYLNEKGIRTHLRVADSVASLRIGFYYFSVFMSGYMHLTKPEVEKLNEEYRDVLYDLAVKQSVTVNDDRPTHIFIRKLMSLVECGENIILPEGYGEEPQKGCLGYQDEQYYYLFLDQCHKAVKRLCDSQQENFPISSQALAKALAEEKFIEVKNGCNTTPKRFGNRKCRVMFLRKDAIKQVYDSDDESA